MLTYACIHIYMNMLKLDDRAAGKPVRTHTHTHTTHTYIYIHHKTCRKAVHVSTHINMYILTNSYTYTEGMTELLKNLYMYGCMCVYIYIYTYICIHIYVYTYICIHTHTHVQMG